MAKCLVNILRIPLVQLIGKIMGHSVQCNFTLNRTYKKCVSTAAQDS